MNRARRAAFAGLAWCLSFGAASADELDALLAPTTVEEMVEQYVRWDPLHQALAQRRLARTPQAARTEVLRRAHDLTSSRARLLELARELPGSGRAEDVSCWLGDPDLATRRAAAAAFAQWARPGRDTLREALAPHTASRAMVALSRRLPCDRIALASQSASALGTLTRSHDPEIRPLALELLCDVDDACAIAWVGPAVTEVDDAAFVLERIATRAPLWPHAWLASYIDDWVQQWPELRLRGALAKLEHARAVSAPRPSLPSWNVIVPVALQTAAPEADAALALLASQPRAAGEALLEALTTLDDATDVGTAAQLAIEWLGRRAMTPLLEFVRAEGSDASMDEAVFEALARLPSSQTAMRLSELVPELDDASLTAMAPTARAMPAGEARTELLAAMLPRLTGSERARTFQSLAMQGGDDTMPLLLDALDGTASPRTRRELLQTLAQARGASHPRILLPRLSAWFEADDPTDRVVALACIPSVALGDRAADVAQFLADRFRDEAPVELLNVLVTLDGPAVEATFVSLFHDHPAGASVRETVLQRAAQLRGDATRTMLLDALTSPDDIERKEALRALMTRLDPAVPERALEVLRSLSDDWRIPLLGTLARCAHLPGMDTLFAALLETWTDDESRIVLLEIGTDWHPEAVRPLVERLLDNDASDALKAAALDALGRLPDAPEHRARLHAMVRPVLEATPRALLELDQTLVERAVAAARAWRHGDVETIVQIQASVWMRAFARESAWDLIESVTRGETRRVRVDLGLVERLASRPTDLVLPALDEAWRGIAPLDALLDERVFLHAARVVEQAGADATFIGWCHRAPQALWPTHSRNELAGRVLETRARSAWPLGDFSAVVPQDLDDASALTLGVAHCELTPRTLTDLFGPTRARTGRTPRRTLAAASWLERGREDQTFRAEAVRDAIREAGRDGALRATLAEHFLPHDLVAARVQAQRALEDVPTSSHALGLLAWIEHRQGHLEARDRLREREQREVDAGRTRRHAFTILRDAAIRWDEGNRSSAVAAARPLWRSEAVREWARRQAGLGPLADALDHDAAR